MVFLNLLLGSSFSHQTRFKLHLQSQVGDGKQLSNSIPPLPLNKTVVEVFSDSLVYLLECASRYIKDNHADGEDLWASVKDQIYLILSHLNGWEGAQQMKMQKAAVLAKLIPDTTAGHAHISFVMEGEASLHFSVKNGLPIGVIEAGEGVVIVDAGGGTIDISSYAKTLGKLTRDLRKCRLLKVRAFFFQRKIHHSQQAIFMAQSTFPSILGEYVLCIIQHPSCSVLCRLLPGFHIFDRPWPHCQLLW